MKEIVFNEILKTIENESIRLFGEKCIQTIPPYFWEIPASSSLKYHAAYACTKPLGLAKHTVALVRFLNYMFSIESIGDQFTSRERDLLRIAGMMHDTMKSGTQADYEKSHYTKFNHPLLAADLIRNMDGLPKDEIEFIAHCIEPHMGQWNTDKRYPDIILPKPSDKYQIILHLADYLASRKDIEIKFNTEETHVEPPTVDNYKLDFGKHSGKTIQEVYELDRGWLRWARDNITREPFATLIKEFKPKN
jgi:23S rRNA maturation-related 3'-5' exoribonuclease YhaM